LKKLSLVVTQERLAFEAEIDLTYVGGIERGKRNPSLAVMARIAEALSMPSRDCYRNNRLNGRFP